MGGTLRWEFDAVTPALLLPGPLLAMVGGLALLTTTSISVLDGIIGLAPGSAVTVGTYGVLRSGLPTSRYKRILGWIGVGAVSVVLVPITIVLSATITVDPPQVAVTTGLGLGALGGLLAGFQEARAIERAQDAQRKRIEAEFARAEQARLEQLNHLLRHDIINNVAVIQGYTEILLEDTEQTNVAELETIKRQADATVQLIQNVRTYLDSLADAGTPTKSIDISAMLARELSVLESTFSEVVLETDVPDGIVVRADDLLGSVFSNLLRNAVLHNTADQPTVAVSATTTADTVRVTVADNGSGLPASVQEQLFEPNEKSDHGFGLFLVHSLVDQYGGSVTVESTGETGTTFAVELPLADASQ